MTPAETLAAARGNVVGPYAVAQTAWVETWSGPAVVRLPAEPEYGRLSVRLIPVVIEDGCVLSGDNDFTMGEPGIFPVGPAEYDTLLLDLRRPEVRDHLVRRGAPAWARDIPVALWVWATTGEVPEDVLNPWEPWYGRAKVRIGTRKTRRCTLSPTASGCWEWSYDVVAPEHRQIVCATVETGPEGMACADLAALRAGCILDEPDGWLLPLPDGGVGFWPES